MSCWLNRFSVSSSELENPYDTAKNAYDMLREDNVGVPPAAKSQAVSWARLHPEDMNEARDEDHASMAEQFAKQCGDSGLHSREDFQWIC